MRFRPAKLKVCMCEEEERLQRRSVLAGPKVTVSHRQKQQLQPPPETNMEITRSIKPELSGRKILFI